MSLRLSVCQVYGKTRFSWQLIEIKVWFSWSMNIYNVNILSVSLSVRLQKEKMWKHGNVISWPLFEFSAVHYTYFFATYLRMLLPLFFDIVLLLRENLDKSLFMSISIIAFHKMKTSLIYIKRLLSCYRYINCNYNLL